MYKILKMEGRAKRAHMETVHGNIETPVFMNVGTAAAIKGAVSTEDLQQIGTQVELSNTYHLHVRPGDEVVKKMGGLHKFMVWDKPILTDSGGFQVFSLAGLRKIKEEGVFPLPRRRKKDLYGTGGEYADPVQPGIHDCDGLRRVPIECGRPTLCAEFRGPYGKMAAAMQG